MAEIALWWQNNWSRMATRDDRQYDYCIVWPAFVVWTTRHTTQHNCIVMKWNISLRPKRSRIRNGILIDHIVMVCSNILNALYRKLNVGCGAGYMEDNATKMCWCEWQCDGRWLAVPALIMLWWHEWTDQILIKSVKFPLHSAWEKGDDGPTHNAIGWSLSTRRHIILPVIVIVDSIFVFWLLLSTHTHTHTCRTVMYGACTILIIYFFVVYATAHKSEINWIYPWINRYRCWAEELSFVFAITQSRFRISKW